LTKPAAAPEVLVPVNGRAEARARARRLGRRRLGRTLWAAFLALDGPLLAAVAVGLAAAYLHPGPFWWAQLLAVLLPYLTWVLGVAAAVPLLARRWGWFALHALLLAAVAGRAFPPERFGSAPAPAEGDLVVMSFNVPQSGPSGEALSDSLVAFLEAHEPDVVALQDVWTYPGAPRPLRHAVHVEAAVERLPYAFEVPPRPGSTGPARTWTTGVPVLVREGRVAGAEVLDQRPVPIDVGDADPAAVSAATRTHFRWRGREGVLYNVHLRSFGSQKPWEDRIRLFEPGTWLPYLRRYRDVYRARAAEAEQIAAAVEAEALPVLVVGDFNATPNNWEYRRLRRGRRDAFFAAGLGSGHTYRADRPFVRIDYVLADEAFAVTAAEVPLVGFSDHRPLVVRLRWAEEGE
jgi:endonuclease/exonuclease/phosphatase (EEP) superfamily protein YafD